MEGEEIYILMYASVASSWKVGDGGDGGIGEERVMFCRECVVSLCRLCASVKHKDRLLLRPGENRPHPEEEEEEGKRKTHSIHY